MKRHDILCKTFKCAKYTRETLNDFDILGKTLNVAKYVHKTLNYMIYVCKNLTVQNMHVKH